MRRFLSASVCVWALAGLWPGLASAAAGARCEAPALKALHQVWRLPLDRSFTDASCKPWPDDPSRLLTLAVYGRQELPGGAVVAKLGLALLDARTLKPLLRHSEEIGEDAVFELADGVYTLDTARYRMAAGVRAFGVVSRMVNRASCPDGGLDHGWRLFALDAAAIRPLTREDLYLSTWRYRDGPECKGGDILHETTLTLDVRPRPATWADLLITARRSDRTSPLVIQVPFKDGQYDLQDAQARLAAFNMAR